MIVLITGQPGDGKTQGDIHYAQYKLSSQQEAVLHFVAIFSP